VDRVVSVAGSIPTKECATLRPSLLIRATALVLVALASSAALAHGQGARADTNGRESGTIERLLADTASVPLVAPLAGATLAGVVRDSTGRLLRDASVTVSGVRGEWRTNADGRFLVRGIPSGTRVVSVHFVGFVASRRLANFGTRDSLDLAFSMSRVITRLNTVTIREREHFDALKSELDQRRRAGFGYRADSLELARLPGVMEAFNFPGVHTSWSQGRWSIYMTGVYSIPSRNGSGTSLSCRPAIWLDGQVSDQDMIMELKKDEIALIEVFNSAARAPLQYGSSGGNCGVVLVWRKRYISP
jgi:hypothetical protein